VSWGKIETLDQALRVLELVGFRARGPQDVQEALARFGIYVRLPNVGTSLGKIHHGETVVYGTTAVDRHHVALPDTVRGDHVAEEQWSEAHEANTTDKDMTEPFTGAVDGQGKPKKEVTP